MVRFSLYKEITCIYKVTDDLPIQVVELYRQSFLNRRTSFPKCSYCGEDRFWNVTWPAALALARYLARKFSYERLNGCRALVFGCGVGLEGLVLAKLGAFVSFLDHIPDALQLVYRNCILNEIESFETICCCWRNLKDILKIGKYDLLVGSDVLYNPDEMIWIESLLTTTLKTDGIAFFADPGRSNSVINFFSHLVKNGFRVKSLQANLRRASRNQRIRIYCVNRS